MRKYIFVLLLLFASCTAPHTTGSSSKFISSKALVELAYLEPSTNELQKLLEDIKTGSVDKKYLDWNNTFPSDIKQQVIQMYINGGHKGL